MDKKPSAPKKRGRKSLNLPPSEAEKHLKEVQRKATATRIVNLKSKGKERLQAFVSSGIPGDIETLKNLMELKTQGEVIDALVLAEKIRRKLI
ncbi:MAG TPA: hypothetical protein VJ654_12965 [Noviherbaspirillum sp.]|nr:hypothetical protein [Noviherbaspirillum sp.]